MDATTTHTRGIEMSGNCVARIACPTCGDENSLQVFEEDGVRTGYCFQPTCKTYYTTQALSSLPDSDVEYTPQEPKDISWALTSTSELSMVSVQGMERH